MTLRSLTSLRSQLLLLILFGVLPTAVLVVRSAVDERRQQTAAVRADLVGLARMAAGEQAREIAAAHELLFAVSQNPTSIEPAACTRLLGALVGASPRYTNLSMFRPDGTLICSGRAPIDAVAIGRADWFARARDSRDVVVGKYEAAALHVASPVVTPAGARGVSVATLDFAWASRLARDDARPAGGGVMVVLQDGRIASRDPRDAEAWSGVDPALLERLGPASSGSFELASAGGDTLVAFQALAPALDGQAWAVVRVPVSAAYASADARLRRSLGALALVALLFVVGTQAVRQRLTLRPLRAVLRATRRLAAGHLGARTGVAADDSEVGQLAASFDRMATSLEAEQRELRDSNARVRTLVEQSLVGVYVMHGDRIVYANGAAAAIVGCDPGEVKGLPLLSLVDSGDADRARDHVRVLLEGGENEAHCTLRIRRGDGAPAVVDVYGRRIDYEGRPAILGTMLDVTERTRTAEAERAVHDELVRLRLAVEASSEIVLITDRDGVIRFINPAFTRVYGYTAAEVVGAATPRIVESGLRPDAAYDESWRRILRGEVVRGEMQNRTKDGRLIMVDGSATPVRDAAGAIVGVLAIQHDVSERHAAREERDRLASVVEQMAEATMVFDPERRIVYVNPAWERLTGYAAADVLGHSLRLLDSGEHDGEFYEGIWDRIGAGGTWTGQVTNRRKDGSLYTEEATVTPIRDADGRLRYFVSVGQDVAEQRGLELQLRQSQKMEAIGRLAGGIAHDFNNLLTVILGQGEMLDAHISPGDTAARRHADAIHAAADRAARLTRQLLAFSRRQQMSVRPLNVRELVDSTAGMLSRLIGEDITLQVVHGADLGAVRADPVHFEQVLMNLAVNARDAMPDGGTLTIETANVVLDREYVDRHVGVTPGPYLQISVTDSGCGMSEETRSRIFEPFFTTKEPGKGTGLGLSTVFGIVKQLGGDIWVYSEKGRGTTFKIYLPRTDAAPEVEAARAVDPPMPGLETILLVEDDENVRGLLTETIARYGYRVLAAEGASAAEAHLKSCDGPVHLMLTDIVMPGVSGPQLYERVARTVPDMRVLFMSGYTDRTVLQSKLVDEGSAFIAKPFTHTDLARKIRAVLDADATAAVACHPAMQAS